MSLVANKYNLIEKIGSGSFGAIYKGQNIRTNEFVAVKVEAISSNIRLLKNESAIYYHLIKHDGIPSVKWFGKDDVNYYMVFELLGESLESLKQRRGRFDLNLTLQVGIQILNLLKTIHYEGLIHRDIKPDNFLLGLNDKKRQLYIIDFGFCKSYRKGIHHIPIRKTSSLIGSPSFASINAHEFTELSRRDDLESLGYMLLYLYKGTLNLHQESDDFLVNNESIKQKKTDIFNDATIPCELVKYMSYVRSLGFDEDPDYSVLLSKKKKAFL
jgi:serine/threonine protein kinase